jgi:hypothetical protein
MPQINPIMLATPEQNFRDSIKRYYASMPVCQRCRKKKLIEKRRREVGLCAGCEKKASYAKG